MTVKVMSPFRMWRDMKTVMKINMVKKSMMIQEKMLTNVLQPRVKQSLIVLRMKLPQLQTMQKVEKLLPLQMIRKLEIRGV